MRELVVASKGQFYSNAESFDGHDGDRSDCGANGDVDKRILLAIYWRDLIDHDGGEYCDYKAVKKEA